MGKKSRREQRNEKKKKDVCVREEGMIGRKKDDEIKDRCE